jgi:hypothetical protein
VNFTRLNLAAGEGYPQHTTAAGCCMMLVLVLWLLFTAGQQ